MRCMPPRITGPALNQAVERRLRKSFELVVRTEATPPEQREAAWDQATLPNHISGVGIGGHTRICPAAYAASLLACLPCLIEAAPTFATLDILTSTLPMVADFRIAYEGFKAERDRIAHIYETQFDLSYTSLSTRPHQTPASTPSLCPPHPPFPSCKCCSTHSEPNPHPPSGLSPMSPTAPSGSCA
jgi:hypothetical protein